MKNSSLILIVLLFFIFGCSKENQIIDPIATQEKIQNEQITLAPLTNYTTDEIMPVVLEKKGKLKTKTIKFHESSGTMGASPNPGECTPYGGYYQAWIEGTGHATHLGLFAVQNTYCIDMYGNPISPIYGVMTAANGAQLFSQMTGMWYDELVELSYFSYIVYDGNRRFDGATGNILMWGNIDYVNNTWYLEGEGSITY